MTNKLPSGRKALKAAMLQHFKAKDGVGICRGNEMLNDREKILSALREKPLKIFEVMKRANISNQEACQSLLLKMRDEGAVKFDIHKGQWLIA
jgi:hypothetical protein